MSENVGGIFYIFTTVAGVCFIAGLLVLSGGDTNSGKDRGNISYTDEHA